MRHVQTYTGASVVYFLQAEGTGRIRIGISRRPLERIKEIRAGSSETLRLVAMIRGGKDKEAFLHDLFADARIHGEWFEATPDLVSYINAHAQETRQVIGAWLSV
jgi:Meiotically up-regulated gene 113